MGRRLINNPLYFLLLILFFLAVIFPVIYSLFNILLQKNVQNIFEWNWIYLLLKSILVAVFVAFLASLIGLFLAFILYKVKIKVPTFLYLLIWFPLFLSPYFFAEAYRDFFYLLGCKQCFKGIFALIFVLTLIYIPLAVLIIGSALRAIDAKLEEAGLLLTEPYRVIKKILIPLLKPALYTAFSLIFVFSISNFSVPAYLHVQVLTTEIFTQFAAFYRHSLAIFQSLFLVLISLILLWRSSGYLLSAGFLSIGGKGLKQIKYHLPKQKYALLFLYLYLFLSLILPVGILFLQSLKGGFPVFQKAFYLLLPAFVFTFKWALLAAFLTLLTGTIAAYYSVRKHKSWLDICLLTAFVLPSLAAGVAWINFYNRKNLLLIYSGMSILMIAYVGKYAYIASRIIANSLKQYPVSLEEAARLQQSNSFELWTKIIIPLNFRAISTAFLISFVFIVGELGMSIMLYPPGTELLSVKVFTLMANAPLALTASMLVWVLIYLSLSVSFFYLIIRLLAKLYKRKFKTELL